MKFFEKIEKLLPPRTQFGMVASSPFCDFLGNSRL